MRLYLPRNWLQDLDRLVATGVPEEYRLPQTRGSIALDLLDAARADGWLAETVFVSSGLENDSGLRDGLDQRGLVCWTEQMPGTAHGDGQALSRARSTRLAVCWWRGWAWIISKAGHGAASITMPAW